MDPLMAPAPCTVVLRSAPVEAVADVAEPKPRLVDKVVVVTVIADVEEFPLLLMTIWLPLSEAVAPAANVVFAFRSLTIWPLDVVAPEVTLTVNAEPPSIARVN